MKLEPLFPTKYSLFIFIAYMGLFVNQGLLVTASQQTDGSYSYNVVTVVLLTETCKLLASAALYINSSSCHSLTQSIRPNLNLLLLYLVPSFLYCLYNNLAFYNLGIFDPTTYFLLLQLRVVITGILFQVTFKKQLTLIQWLSLGILTIGCIIKQFSSIQKGYPDRAFDENENIFNAGNIFQINYLFIFIQLFCSCFAGVYNEKLLKEIGADVHILIQNVFMYLDSIFWNVIVLLINGIFFEAFSYESLHKVCQLTVIVIIINNSFLGIVTSYFLRSLNSILKNFASALELVFTAVLSWVFFGVAIDMWTMLSIILVVYSTYLYSRNPVVNRGRLDAIETHDAEDPYDHNLIVNK